MPHYAHMVTVNRLEIAAHIGFYEAERETLQPIEVCFRLYYAKAPDCTRDDHASFIDYGVLCKVLTDYVVTRKFNLIEYMGAELFRHLREYLDGNGFKDIKLWLRLNKVAAPVKGLQGGASFTQCDLPPDATIASHCL